MASIEAGIERQLAALPNLPDPSVPDGDSEDDAEVVREMGTLPEFDFEPRGRAEAQPGTRLIFYGFDNSRMRMADNRGTVSVKIQEAPARP